MFTIVYGTGESIDENFNGLTVHVTHVRILFEAKSVLFFQRKQFLVKKSIWSICSSIPGFLSFIFLKHVLRFVI